MVTFREANNIRMSLKMSLSRFHWYSSSTIMPNSNGYFIVIGVKKLDDSIRKIVPPLIRGIEVKVETE